MVSILSKSASPLFGLGGFSWRLFNLNLAKEVFNFSVIFIANIKTVSLTRTEKHSNYATEKVIAMFHNVALAMSMFRPKLTNKIY